MHQLTTTFVRRLRDRDEAAWFELWQVFGPVLRAQLSRWGGGRIGVETIRDLSQETLATLSRSIERFDPERGVRFSTWLLAIARHVLGDELDRRGAAKRGSGRRAMSLGDRDPVSDLHVDAAYERRMFEAKVHAAIRRTESESVFVAFQVYRMRIFDGRTGRLVAEQLDMSEATISRHLQSIRIVLREALENVVAQWSFTPEERAEISRAGLAGDDRLFDEALAEIYHSHEARRRAEDAEARSAGVS
ncbi:MAG: sigma-70 family RNA polymerase sigma factor [Planctomycetota bacterium]|nr:sigma-70 family RNA polymerase sigma factor [Planctomycetota bacterium]